MAYVLPLLEELQTCLSPVELFSLFSRELNSFFLDSAMDAEKLGRFSLMGTDPFLVFSSRGEEVTLKEGDRTSQLKGNPFDIFGRCLEKYRFDSALPGLPCSGGAIGYFSYDLGRFIETLPSRAVDDLNLPESCFGFYDVILVFDNLAKRAYLVSSGFPETDLKRRFERAKTRLKEFKSRIQSRLPLTQPLKFTPQRFFEESELKANFTCEGYIKAVEKARRYILEGEIYEVNLSQRFEAPIAVPPYELYLRLREINPAPFAAYLNFDQVTVAGSSPERFLRLQNRRVETRPIKGTVRRGRDVREDEAKAKWLLNSEKNRAENMMIADLERNDLGRVCRTGTVEVTEFATLEKFPTVFHLTSTIVGDLREDVSLVDLLKATFPGGSITGAPKIRAMEIIDELEPTRRSIYTGSIGYFGFEGNLDLNIVIRSFLIKNNRAYFQLGGAVVYDSDPEEEYNETLDKGKALFRALNLAGPSSCGSKND
jgi:para-aminobenzoate synthetase component I